MKATGMVRYMDGLGRIVFPKELRRNLNWEEGTPIEIFVEDNKLILRKYCPLCIFTGTDEDLIDYKGFNVSKSAVEKMARIVGLVK